VAHISNSGDAKQSASVTRIIVYLSIKYNKHFPPYILGTKRFPDAPPGHYGIGDANEAAYYMNDSMLAWENTPGAIDWIKKCMGTKR